MRHDHGPVRVIPHTDAGGGVKAKAFPDRSVLAQQAAASPVPPDPARPGAPAAGCGGSGARGHGNPAAARPGPRNPGTLRARGRQGCPLPGEGTPCPPAHRPGPGVRRARPDRPRSRRPPPSGNTSLSREGASRTYAAWSARWTTPRRWQRPGRAVPPAQWQRRCAVRRRTRRPGPARPADRPGSRARGRGRGRPAATRRDPGRRALPGPPDRGRARSGRAGDRPGRRRVHRRTPPWTASRRCSEPKDAGPT